jgi:hypothetical protein
LGTAGHFTNAALGGEFFEFVGTDFGITEVE